MSAPGTAAPAARPVAVTSFGYLHGAPPEGAHITFDLRAHFRDPHVSPELRHLTAWDAAVRAAVLATPGIGELVDAAAAAVAAYLAGPSAGPVAVAVGCAGGRHRAATVAMALADRIDGADVTHRDLDKAVVDRPPGCYTPLDITPVELQPAGIAAAAREGWVVDLATDPTRVTDWPARQAAALVPYEVIGGYPRNPAGRTGKVGRDLGRWGENPAVDPVVVAGVAPGRRVLLIRRDDCPDCWAIPGGMVDPGETAQAALVRELREETGVDLAGVEPAAVRVAYVDDPRATDWAWVCTTVALFRVAEPVDATAGSDALDVRWFPFDDLDQLRAAVRAAGGRLYAPHETLLALADDRPAGAESLTREGSR